MYPSSGAATCDYPECPKPETDIDSDEYRVGWQAWTMPDGHVYTFCGYHAAHINAVGRVYKELVSRSRVGIVEPGPRGGATWTSAAQAAERAAIQATWQMGDLTWDAAAWPGTD